MRKAGQMTIVKTHPRLDSFRVKNYNLNVIEFWFRISKMLFPGIHNFTVGILRYIFFSKNWILWNLTKWAYKSRPLPSGGKAFIDFAEPQQAASAKTALQGFKVTPEKAIQLTFAKN